MYDLWPVAWVDFITLFIPKEKEKNSKPKHDMSFEQKKNKYFSKNQADLNIAILRLKLQSWNCSGSGCDCDCTYT